MTPQVCIIVAMTKDGVIGKDNDLPWTIPSDLKFFRKITTGGTVIMGRKTFESIGKPLPNRENIVVGTKIPNSSAVTLTPSLSRALEIATTKRIFFIGGRRIYEEALGLANVMYISLIKKDYEGNVFFPEIPASWKERKSIEFDEFFLKKYVKEP